MTGTAAEHVNPAVTKLRKTLAIKTTHLPKFSPTEKGV
jgi:hypothetical protein